MDINEYRRKLRNLTGDAAEGARDAILSIMAARQLTVSPGGPGGPGGSGGDLPRKGSMGGDGGEENGQDGPSNDPRIAPKKNQSKDEPDKEGKEKKGEDESEVPQIYKDLDDASKTRKKLSAEDIKIREIERKRALNLADTTLSDIDKALSTETNKQSIQKLQKAKKEIEKAKDKLKSLDPKAAIITTWNNANEALNQAILDARALLKEDTIDLHKETDQEDRVKTLKLNPIKLQDFDAEDEIHKKVDMSAKEIRQAERAEKEREKKDAAERKAKGLLPNMSEFGDSLYWAIRNQVQQLLGKSSSWSALNRKHTDDGIVVPGDKIKEIRGKVPSIDLYLDCSGSWNSRQSEKCKRALGSILEYERRGVCKINIYYFANNVYTTEEPARHEDGTGAWSEIIKTIKKNGTQNVVIMTDLDMERYDYYSSSVTVPGVVWWVWKNDNTRSSVLPHYLRGEANNLEFVLDT